MTPNSSYLQYEYATISDLLREDVKKWNLITNMENCKLSVWIIIDPSTPIPYYPYTMKPEKTTLKVALKEATISYLLLLEERFWWIMRPEKANQGEFLWGKHGLLSREGEFPAQSGLYSYWYCTIPYVPW